MKRILVVAAALAGAGVLIYLATLGCCQLLSGSAKPVPLTQGLNLTPEQGQQVAGLRRDYLDRKAESCRTLCAKRAQMITLLRAADPDRGTLMTLIEEIGREQTALEKATVEHLLAVSRRLEPGQRKKLISRVTEELREACRQTACGAAGECFVAGSAGDAER